MKKTIGISNIVAEAILISIVMGWMGFMVSTTSGIIPHYYPPPLLDPVYCSDDTVYINVIEPGWIEKLDDYNMYVLSGNETIQISEQYFLNKDIILKINSTGLLPRKIVLMSNDLYIVIDRENCRAQLVG